MSLKRSLLELAGLLGSEPTRGEQIVSVASESPLTLDNTTTFTTLQSVEEINTTPTSFSPFGPAWTGGLGSTALPTIGGVYDGSNGTGTLDFDVRGDGVHGQDRLRIRVRTGGSTLQNITIQANDPLDQQYAIGNGLTLALGAGSIVRNDTFTVNIFDTVGSVVNTANPFDGVRNANPNLDPGQSVTGGTFLLNGQTINVGASDSIDTIISQINASSAGVTASFDSGAERLVLTQNTAGSAPLVDLSGDNSGLFDALKLAAAVAVAGRDADIDQPLANLTQFQGVQSGTVTINGAAIAIDVQADSLNAILARINSTQQEATVSFAEPPQRVTVASNTPGTDIILDDGGTGLFAALNIRGGAFLAKGGNNFSAQRAAEIAAAAQQASKQLAETLDAFKGNPRVQSILGSLRGSLDAHFGGGSAPLDSGYGVRRVSAQSDGLVIDARLLGQALQRRAHSVRDFLVGDTHTAGTGGFIGALQQSVDGAIAALDNRIGGPSSLVDLFV